MITAYFEDISTLNPEGWILHFADAAISYDPVGQPPTRVHEGFREFFQRMQTTTTFDQLDTTTEHSFVAGNEAAVKWTIWGVSKSGKVVTLEGITVFEVNEAEQIQSLRAYWNSGALLAQLR